MALTPYSLCPGGTGKKLKFCSPGHLEELEKIYKLLEGEQFLACLNYIQSLLEKDSGVCRACLLALKCQVLEEVPDRQEELLAAAKQFYAEFPESPVAVAEAMRAMIIEANTAIQEEIDRRELRREFNAALVDDALARQREQLIQWNAMMERAVNLGPLLFQTVEKIPLLIEIQLNAGLTQAAAEWTHFLLMSEQFRQAGQQFLNRIVTDHELPLFVRTLLPMRIAPEGLPWSEKFNALVTDLRQFHWTAGEEGMKALAAEFPELEKRPEYLANLALLEEWKCDIPAARRLWEKFLETDADFFEKLEVQTRIFGTRAIPLDDAVDVYHLDYALTETDAVKDALLADPCVRMISQDLPPSEAGVAIGMYSILDAEKMRSAEELDAPDFSVEDLPMAIATVILWARQTDREPRLEIMNILNPDAVREHVQQRLGLWLAGEPKVDVERHASATFDSFSREIDFPRDTGRERGGEVLEAYYRDLLLNRWVHFPLGVLGRKSVLAAAGEPANRLKVEAVLQIIRSVLEPRGQIDDMLAALREKLSLPELPEVAPEEVGMLHPMFYYLVDVRKIPADDLPRFFQRCQMMGVVDKAVMTARFIIEDKANLPESLWFQAVTFLLRAGDPLSDLHTLADEARAFCERQGIKHSMIDLMEMEIYMKEGNQPQFVKILNHLQAEHQDDPEVIRTLMYLQQSARAAAERMGMGMQPEPESAPGGSGLWTPDGGGNESTGGASKLWVPD